MKQIEERGGDFAANYEILDDNGRRKNECEIARESYISGAKCDHELLTRWHDPKEPPEPGRVVLVKRNPSSIIPYDLGHIDNDGNWVDSWCGSPIDDKIIGWRKIHE